MTLDNFQAGFHRPFRVWGCALCVPLFSLLSHVHTRLIFLLLLESRRSSDSLVVLNYSPLVLSPGTLCTSFSTRGILIVTRQLLIKRFDYLIINFLLYELFHCSFGNRRLVVDSSVTPTRDLSSLLPDCSLPLTYHLFYP